MSLFCSSVFLGVQGVGSIPEFGHSVKHVWVLASQSWALCLVTSSRIISYSCASTAKNTECQSCLVFTFVWRMKQELSFMGCLFSLPSRQFSHSFFLANLTRPVGLEQHVHQALKTPLSYHEEPPLGWKQSPFLQNLFFSYLINICWCKHLISTFWRQRQAEFWASLVYGRSFRTARAVERSPVLKKTKQSIITKGFLVCMLIGIGVMFCPRV